VSWLPLTAFNGRQKRHILADKREHSSSVTAVLTRHKMAEIARINQFLAESANSENGFHRPLTRSQHLDAERTFSQEQDLSVKMQSEKQPERDILAQAAKLWR
jgi:hypothetical protein